MTLGGPQAHDCSGRNDKEEGGAFLLRAEETLGAVLGGYGFGDS
jgi:hypothetical protein